MQEGYLHQQRDLEGQRVAPVKGLTCSCSEKEKVVKCRQVSGQGCRKVQRPVFSLKTLSQGHHLGMRLWEV